MERFARVLGEYRQTTGEPVLLSWLGGEPLLWPPLLTLSQRLRDCHGIGISATTNGSGLHRKRVRSAIVRCFSELTISVDGLADFHDGIRGWPDGWRYLRDGVRKLAQARSCCASALKLHANIVLMRANFDQFVPLCEELVEWGIDEITFNPLDGRDRPEFFPAQALCPHHVRLLHERMPALRDRLASRQVRLCVSAPYLRRIEASANGESLAVDDCWPGERFLFIDKGGHISPCSFTSASLGVAIDAIDSAHDFLALPDRYRWQRADAPMAVCDDCPSTQVFSKFVH